MAHCTPSHSSMSHASFGSVNSVQYNRLNKHVGVTYFCSCISGSRSMTKKCIMNDPTRALQTCSCKRKKNAHSCLTSAMILAEVPLAETLHNVCSSGGTVARRMKLPCRRTGQGELGADELGEQQALAREGSESYSEEKEKREQVGETWRRGKVEREAVMVSGARQITLAECW